MRIMKVATTAILAAGSVVAIPLTASPALAGPGDPCTIQVIGAINVDVPGTVSANGDNCVPNTALSGPLQALNVGVQCGYRGGLYPSTLLLVESICP
jgi:hypothetical protein